MPCYAARKELADGKLQILFAKTLDIEDCSGNRTVFVTMDLIGVLAKLRSTVVQRNQGKYQLPPNALVMYASHLSVAVYEVTSYAVYRARSARG